MMTRVRRHAALLALAAIALLLAAGCNDDETTVVEPGDLAPPLGLYSITGDTEVVLFWWCADYGDDLVGYKVYQAQGSYAGNPLQSVPSAFAVVDSIAVDPPCSALKTLTISGLTNGTTYSFLVVAARDDDWNEISHTSNIIEDTPRYETASVTRLYARQVDATRAGFELLDFSVVDCTDLVDYNTDTGFGDIMVERFDPAAGVRLWIDGINDGWVQDIGYMSDWDQADEAPVQGYADAGHSLEALIGHVYAVWTGTNQYAKVQIVDLDTDDYEWIEIKAAYQPAPGVREYK